MVVAKTKSIPLAMLTAVAAGMAVGTVNGFLVTRVKIPAFIATLGMLFIVRGLTFIISNGGEPIRYNGKAFIWWGNGSLFGIPAPFPDIYPLRRGGFVHPDTHRFWPLSFQHRHKQ